MTNTPINSPLDTQLKELLQYDYYPKLEQLKALVIKAATEIFSEIIQNHQTENIYALALYHNGDCSSYLSVSFSTQTGLRQVAETYTRHSDMSLAEQMVMLKWSPCDSPHHCIYESLSDSIDELIHELSDSLEATWENAHQSLNYEFWGDEYYRFHQLASETIHDTYVQALKTIRETAPIKQYLDQTDCLLYLTAGDIDEQIVHKDIKSICGDDALDKFILDEAEAYRLTEIEYQLREEKRQQEELNPPTTDLTLEDFKDIIENFQPTFTVVNGAVCIKGREEEIYTTKPLSRDEALSNRFPLMDVLSASPHYDELDLLFGHFDGPDFQTNDLLPQIARALTLKLGERLAQQFPLRSFYTYFTVDRSALYHLTFYQNHQDGYIPHFKAASCIQGVTEIRAIGPLKPTVIFPVCMMTDHITYIAHLTGAQFPQQQFTDKSDHPTILLAKSNDSYEDALTKLKILVAEHFDKGFLDHHLDFEFFEYTPENLRGRSNVSEDQFEYEHAQEWTSFEFTPKYISHALVSDSTT